MTAKISHMNIIPVSAIIPTRNRKKVLERTLNSLAKQSLQPVEMIIVDASDNEDTERLCKANVSGLKTHIHYYKALDKGAAVQRNQAMTHARQNVIWLLDDDIVLEPECVMRLWTALQQETNLGGVNAMITNQQYLPPGYLSRLLFQILHGSYEESYAGKCIGPAMNLLPEDRSDLPDVVPVEWLNTTCVMYRREALPHPLFPEQFKGYSLMEDVTLSLTVGKQWKLANARTARIFHDSQPGDHKNDSAVLAKMDLVNRHYVMTQILERETPTDFFKLFVHQFFHLAASLKSYQGWISLPRVLLAKLNGVGEILGSYLLSRQQLRS
ncbi:MAG: glycosyltransferase [Leptolyngbyaceae bacterium]|nr:glycosyltransferase [Leptolyngbyaceae bacterium]